MSYPLEYASTGEYSYHHLACSYGLEARAYAINGHAELAAEAATKAAHFFYQVFEERGNMMRTRNLLRDKMSVVTDGTGWHTLKSAYEYINERVHWHPAEIA